MAEVNPKAFNIIRNIPASSLSQLGMPCCEINCLSQATVLIKISNFICFCSFD